MTLHHDLHAARYFFNPRFQYKDNVHNDGEVMRGTMNVITRLARTMNERLDAMAEVERYMMKLGIYGGYDQERRYLEAAILGSRDSLLETYALSYPRLLQAFVEQFNARWNTFGTVEGETSIDLWSFHRISGLSISELPYEEATLNDLHCHRSTVEGIPLEKYQQLKSKSRRRGRYLYALDNKGWNLRNLPDRTYLAAYLVYWLATFVVCHGEEESIRPGLIYPACLLAEGCDSPPSNNTRSPPTELATFSEHGVEWPTGVQPTSLPLGEGLLGNADDLDSRADEAQKRQKTWKSEATEERDRAARLQREINDLRYSSNRKAKQAEDALR
ncbi:hypothetical protein Taro_005641 [Colocasia esculenta]|uniref:Uncharacterized protein n=1 Tax=Colocasia esculenta TaxID=4460 RepID=A0A843TQD4_COLES|nr:hypothetical protein [Colocasia esculenta]